MKQPARVDFSTHQKLQELVDKWRDIVGVDRVYLIEIIESPDTNTAPAWVDGLSIENPHPSVNIFISAIWAQNNKYDEKEITSVIIHELIHIVIWDQLIQIDPTYTHTGLKARSNEILTMKMTSAIIHSYYDEHKPLYKILGGKNE